MGTFHGDPYSENEAKILEIAKLINFKDYNGDGYANEFVLFGGEYWDCSRDENLIVGYDSFFGAIIYKIIGSDGVEKYWGINFFPDENGNVFLHWSCGDHGSDEDIKVFYRYNIENQKYYFVDKIVSKCY
jgi:hypothetical protein